jgi:hypothetical protein
MARPRVSENCTECGGDYYAKGLCLSHYYRSKRPERYYIPEGMKCVEDNCERLARARERCGSHYNILMGFSKGGGRIRGGAPVKDVVDYRAAHVRVGKARGAAKTHHCSYPYCPKQAQEWALDPNAIHTYEDEQGRVWSLNVYDYMPLCASHHRLIDNQPDDWYIDLWLDTKAALALDTQ